MLAVGIAGVIIARHPISLLPGFMYVGLFKDEGPLRSAPIDPTLILGILLAALCFARWFERSSTPVPPELILLLAVIGGLLLLSLTWTTGGSYGMDKAEKFVTLTALATVAPFFVIRDHRDLRELAGWIVLLAIIAAVAALLTPGSDNPSDVGRLSLGSLGGTIGVSRLLCSGTLILLLAALSLAGRWRLFATALSVGLVGVAAGVGSRGPLIALGLAVLALVVLGVLRLRARMLGLLGIILVSVAFLTVVPLPQTSVSRVTNAIVHPSGSLTEDSRPIMYREALKLIGQHPWLGLGSGGFSTYSGVVSLYDLDELYPHNIFLELGVELGILPMAALAVAVASVLVRLVRGSSFDFFQNLGGTRVGGELPSLAELYLGLLLLDFFAVQFSGDVNDNRTFWAYLGIGWLLASWSKPRRAPMRRGVGDASTLTSAAARGHSRGR